VVSLSFFAAVAAWVDTARALGPLSEEVLSPTQWAHTGTRSHSGCCFDPHRHLADHAAGGRHVKTSDHQPRLACGMVYGAPCAVRIRHLAMPPRALNPDRKPVLQEHEPDARRVRRCCGEGDRGRQRRPAVASSSRPPCPGSTFLLVLVHVVADYGPAGDLAFAEVAQRLVAALPAATILATPVGPFDALAAGFVVAQLALTDGPAERVVFHNVAPRRDEANARRANEGERFTAAEAPNGTLVVGPNSGHSLAFVHDQASLFYLDVPAAGSQFRSRDFLPAAVGRLVAGDRGSVGEPVPSELVPRVPRAVVAYTDGYGNLKTTLDERPAANGERVLVRLGEASATAIVSDGSFSVAEGELALAPGSSGWSLRDGGERHFLELFLRGGSASARLGHPASGTPVVVSRTSASQ
jgi:hypothetical protein